MLSKKQQAGEAEIMSVAINQPHRKGFSSHPADAWMITALGKFCQTRWKNKDTQREGWKHGERYARLIDAERIARGEPPRQCADVETEKTEEESSIEKQLEKRRKAETHLSDAEDAMREVDGQAVWAVKELAWYDRDIPAHMHGRAYNALWKLSAHFERLDNPRRDRY